MINTVVIDANKQDRDKITALLSAQDEIKVLGQGNDGYDALKLISSLKPDIVVFDNHLELIEKEDIPPLVRIRSPSTAVVIIIARISDRQLIRAAANQVSGFVNKDTDLNSLPSILKCISQGGCFISPVLAARILHLFSTMNRKGIDNYKTQAIRFLPKGSGSFSTSIHTTADPLNNLSKMELRILTCIGEGFASYEIAENLDIAVGTVRNYISSVMHKTGLHNRPQMVRYACYYGLVPR